MIPIEPNGIRIYYIDKSRVRKPIVYNSAEYQLDGYVSSSLELCRTISKEFVKFGVFQPNEKGWLYIRLEEKVVEIYENVSISDEQGLLYVTDERIVHETDAGIPLDIYLDRITYVKDHGDDTIRVYWDRDIASINEPISYFDITLPKNIDRDSVSALIKEQIAGFDYDEKFEFAKRDKYYSKLQHKKLCKLSREEDRDLDEYIERYTKTIFGELDHPLFDEEKELILACKLQKWSTDLISHMTSEELEQRIYAKRFFNVGHYYTSNYKRYKEFRSDIRKSRSNREISSIKKMIRGTKS